MSLFRSKRGRRNIRKKAVELEEDGDEGESGQTASPVGTETSANGETRPEPSQPSVSAAPVKKCAPVYLYVMV